MATMLWELKQALYSYRLNLSMDVFRKLFSNRITQPVLLMLLLLSVPGFLEHITLCSTPGTSGCVHVPTSGDYWITGRASLVQFRYGTFKFCKLGYNIELFGAKQMN